MWYKLNKDKTFSPLKSVEEFKGTISIKRNEFKLLDNDIRISTVFLGLDHGYGGNPVLFETMIFGGEHDELQYRYSTYKDSLIGHEAIFKFVDGRITEEEFESIMSKLS